MRKVCGAVLVFRDGVTVEEAEAALEAIKEVLAPDYHIVEHGGKYVKSELPAIYEFDREHGGPVWYLP